MHIWGCRTIAVPLNNVVSVLRLSYAQSGMSRESICWLLETWFYTTHHPVSITTSVRAVAAFSSPSENDTRLGLECERVPGRYYDEELREQEKKHTTRGTSAGPRRGLSNVEARLVVVQQCGLPASSPRRDIRATSVHTSAEPEAFGAFAIGCCEAPERCARGGHRGPRRGRPLLSSTPRAPAIHAPPPSSPQPSRQTLRGKEATPVGG
eukprot:3932491-Rhodomonas_salina.3